MAQSPQSIPTREVLVMQRNRSFMLILLMVLIAPVLAAGQDDSKPEYGLVKAQKWLTLRETMSTGAAEQDRLLTFTPVAILERKEDRWAKVKQPEGKVGWVLASYLTETPFVNVRIDRVNVRRGPGIKYEKIMEYAKHFPLRVLDVAPNGWVKVVDFEGDRGWIHPNLLQYDPVYVITKLPKCNIRKGPGTEHDRIFTAEREVLFKVIEEKEGWLHVKHADGEEGWISAKIVFGWLPEQPDQD